jgi:hypothetical protein
MYRFPGRPFFLLPPGCPTNTLLTILLSSILATCPNRSSLSFTFNFRNYFRLSVYIPQFLIIPNFPSISFLPLLHISFLKLYFTKHSYSEACIATGFISVRLIFNFDCLDIDLDFITEPRA